MIIPSKERQEKQYPFFQVVKSKRFRQEIYDAINYGVEVSYDGNEEMVETFNVDIATNEVFEVLKKYT